MDLQHAGQIPQSRFQLSGYNHTFFSPLTSVTYPGEATGYLSLSLAKLSCWQFAAIGDAFWLQHDYFFVSK